MRDYLAREWAARRGATLERSIQLFGTGGPVAFHRADVPQQDNFCDCGLFLIEFARRFCLSPPRPYLSLRPEGGWPFMLRPTWFAPAEAGDAKRDAILVDLVEIAAQLAAGNPAPAAGAPAHAAANAAAAAAPITLDEPDEAPVAVAGSALVQAAEPLSEPADVDDVPVGQLLDSELQSPLE